MPRSMTGYGAARTRSRTVSVDVEARSVNSRSLKVTLRTPGVLSPREPDIEALIRAQVARGSVSLSVKLKFLKPEDVVRVHAEVVEGFARAVEQLKKKGLVEGPLTAAALTAIPGALEAGAQEPLAPADWKVVRKAVEEALDALDRMRRREAS